MNMRSPVSSFLFAAAMITAGCTSDRDLDRFRKADRELVERAIKDYAKGKVSRDFVLESHDPSVVHLEDRDCVGLNLRKDYAGGDTTLCYNRSGKLIGVNTVGD